MKAKGLKLVALVSILAVLCACSHFVANSYKTLATAGITYDETMKAVAEAYDEGLINDNQKEEVMDIAHKYYVAYQAAVVALEEYKEGNVEQAEAMEKVLKVTQILNELLEKVRPLLKEGKDGA